MAPLPVVEPSPDLSDCGILTITIAYGPESRWHAPGLLEPVLAALAAQGVNPQSTEAWLSDYSHAAASTPEHGIMMWQTHREDA